MPVCSYLVFPARGARDEVAGRLAAMAGCDVARAENAEMLVLVTATPDREADESLRASVESLAGIECLVFTFGEIDPQAGQTLATSEPSARPGSRAGR